MYTSQNQTQLNILSSLVLLAILVTGVLYVVNKEINPEIHSRIEISRSFKSNLSPLDAVIITPVLTAQLSSFTAISLDQCIEHFRSSSVVVIDLITKNMVYEWCSFNHGTITFLGHSVNSTFLSGFCPEDSEFISYDHTFITSGDMYFHEEKLHNQSITMEIKCLYPNGVMRFVPYELTLSNLRMFKENIHSFRSILSLRDPNSLCARLFNSTDRLTYENDVKHISIDDGILILSMFSFILSVGYCVSFRCISIRNDRSNSVNLDDLNLYSPI